MPTGAVMDESPIDAQSASASSQPGSYVPAEVESKLKYVIAVKRLVVGDTKSVQFWIVMEYLHRRAKQDATANADTWWRRLKELFPEDWNVHTYVHKMEKWPAVVNMLHLPQLQDMLSKLFEVLRELTCEQYGLTVPVDSTIAEFLKSLRTLLANQDDDAAQILALRKENSKLRGRLETESRLAMKQEIKEIDKAKNDAEFQVDELKGKIQAYQEDAHNLKRQLKSRDNKPKQMVVQEREKPVGRRARKKRESHLFDEMAGIGDRYNHNMRAYMYEDRATGQVHTLFNPTDAEQELEEDVELNHMCPKTRARIEKYKHNLVSDMSFEVEKLWQEANKKRQERVQAAKRRHDAAVQKGVDPAAAEAAAEELAQQAARQAELAEQMEDEVHAREEKELRELINMLDRDGVTQRAYHNLSMFSRGGKYSKEDGLAPSWKVNAYRTKWNQEMKRRLPIHNLPNGSGWYHKLR
jgi:hypothetical protein